MTLLTVEPCIDNQRLANDGFRHLHVRYALGAKLVGLCLANRARNATADNPESARRLFVVCYERSLWSIRSNDGRLGSVDETFGVADSDAYFIVRRRIA